MSAKRRESVKIAGGTGRESGSGVGGRRVSYKYEDEESGEARAKRVEEERESVRWG